MATPRVFISSTCYDLQELRFQLRKFVQDFGYEPVMSEFGDIFYEFNDHVQDACRQEISRSQMFILIVGNYYGSIYHRHIGNPDTPDSVTLQEFRKALDVQIPKFMFINRWVQYDYDNYRRIFNKYLTENFAKREVSSEDLDKVKQELKKQFDRGYPFPQESYRYVFYFLDIINNLTLNNAMFSFETFDEIRETLRKQWAGLVYDALVNSRALPTIEIESFLKKLDRIENQILILAKGKTENGKDHKITIDLNKVVSELKIEELQEIQSRIGQDLTMILMWGNQPRLQFKEKVSETNAIHWLQRLGELLRAYKWSQSIPVTEIFSEFHITFWKDKVNVLYEYLLDLSAIFSNLEPDDQQALGRTVAMRLNELYVPPVNESEVDDLPF